ncbi:MAG: hypothetical protein LBR48_02530 [Dysgonamonadaceae bacterium]|jgi:glutamyl-tRNA reductase|nr:hypothetical protein [Dysgonamonadaceae bacterium]
MKNKIITVSLCATFLFVFAACKNNSKAKADEQKTEVVAPEDTVTEEAEVVIPTLKDASAQKFVNDYAVFVDEYIDAYTTNDPQKIKKIKAKSEKFSKHQTDIIVSKLLKTPTEYQKFAEYMQKMADKLAKVQ